MNHGRPPSRLPQARIAIASPGIGLVQRGFERLFSQLYETTRDACNLTLIKGGGPSDRHERVPRFLPRNGPVLRRIPLHRLIRRTPFHVECLTFALGMLPWLRAGHFDLVHTIDPPLTRLLYTLRRRLHLPFRLLYTEGTNMAPTDYPPADHMQHISAAKYQIAIQYGIPASYQTLLPAGISARQFDGEETRDELRARHGVPPETFVVLCVAALNRWHKRVDHVVEEFSRLGGNCLLWLDGSMDHGEPDLPHWIQSRLGDRCRITRVRSDQVGQLYRLADVKVLGSVEEAFALVIPEALSTGLPVLAHDSPHFRWLIGSNTNLVDMTRPGALAERLEALRQDPSLRTRLQHREEIIRRFDWDHLRPQYLRLYDHVLGLPIRTAAGAFAPRIPTGTLASTP